jgi:hypothetical protein
MPEAGADRASGAARLAPDGGRRLLAAVLLKIATRGA